MLGAIIIPFPIIMVISQLFFRAATARLWKYHTGGYGLNWVYRAYQVKIEGAFLEIGCMFSLLCSWIDYADVGNGPLLLNWGGGSIY